MGANTQIEWAHHTFNPWVGCHKISPGCKHCYAEAWAKRWGRDFATPRVASDRAWKEPLRWNREAAAAGRRERVFCASLADVFEDASELIPARHRLFELINATPSLDWLLLTKRPESAEYWLHWYGENDDAPVLDRWPLRNLWLGVSVEAQPWADQRIPALLRIPAELVAVRFLSCEPLLGPVYVSGGIDWVIVGGESGPDARTCEIAWVYSIVEQCRALSVPVFVKQLGAHIRDRNDSGFDAEADEWTEGPDGEFHPSPLAWPAPHRIEQNPDGYLAQYFGAPVRVHLRDWRHGGEPDEWPAGLRVRQFPIVDRTRSIPSPRG